MVFQIRQIVIVLLTVMFLPALLMMFLAPQPEMHWQHAVWHFITQELNIKTGISGPFPFYTVALTAYFSVFSTIWAAVLFWMIWQEERENIPRIAQFKFWDGLIIGILFIGLIYFSFSMMQWHFSKHDMTVGLGRNGYLFQNLYQYKLGIIFGELFFSFLLIFSQLAILISGYGAYDFMREKLRYGQ